METFGAESLHASLEKGELVTLPGITSIATSLGAIQVAERAFEEAKKGNVRSVVVSDGDAARACVRFADEERMVVEVACGASVAMCYDKDRLKKLLPKLTPESKVVVVVCGGSNVNLGMLEGYRKAFGSGKEDVCAAGVGGLDGHCVAEVEKVAPKKWNGYDFPADDSLRIEDRERFGY